MRLKLKLTENGDVLQVDQNGVTHVVNNSKPLKVKDVIGRSLQYIGAYKKLDNTKQVVALIDDVNLLPQNSYNYNI